jgi:hypothetical protein
MARRRLAADGRLIAVLTVSLLERFDAIVL